MDPKYLIQQTFLSFFTKEENNSGFYTFEKEQYEQIISLITPLILANDTDFVFDLKTAFPDTDFVFFNLENTTEEYRYVKQGGGDLYSYIKLSIKAIEQPLICIKEQLPENIQELLGPDLPKNICPEWIQVYPYILKAIVDHCVKNHLIGIVFSILEVRFHPIDYKPYAYYICTRKLLHLISEKAAKL